MTEEEYAAICLPVGGVEIHRQLGGDTLYVDGIEVWTDWKSEPEDMVMSRDLVSFVHALRALAEERARLRAENATLRDAVVRWKAREEEYDIACSENPDGGGANPKRMREAGQRCDEAAAALRRLVG